MQQFALASVYPRSIAWLIRHNEWSRFEKIIKYNCALVGGYFNVIIPLTAQDSVSEEYQRFLIEYDPDIVVLAPAMRSKQLDFLSVHLHSFGIIPWESVSQIATLDPWAGGTGINAALGPRLTDKMQGIAIIAVADDEYSDTSRLAMVACGDVQPRQPFLDDDMELDARGHREVFLAKVLRSEYHIHDIEAQLREDSKLVPAPNRYQLSKLILEENKFPLSGITEILKACCRLQHHLQTYLTFIGLTAYYKETSTPGRTHYHTNKSYPSLAILVSDNFGLEEAVLFWNLRACGVYVSWLSFLQIESNLDEIVTWLDYNYGGILYASMSQSFDIAFSSSVENISRLQIIVEGLQKKRQHSIPTWRIVLQDDLIFYDYIRPCIKQERVLVTKDGSRCSFVPKLPQEGYFGEYTITLKWDAVMLPQNSNLVHDLVSSETLEGFMPLWRDGHKVTEKGIIMPKFRVTKDRYLKSQISSE